MPRNFATLHGHAKPHGKELSKNKSLRCLGNGNRD